MRIEAIITRLSQDPAAQMIEDSRLPSDVHPEYTLERANPRHVLLTGATGFLGAYLLQSILRETAARVCCLVRGGESGTARIRANLETYGIWDPDFDNRIDVVEGNLERPNAGMPAASYAALSRSIDAVYHCGAAVNWIYPYRRLSGVNVRGTLELLRFACAARPKEFHYISSSAVCYSTIGPRRIDENVDMLPFIRGIHMGYAQAKCVAEALVRQAGDRGLPVAIYRPALISGDSRTGRSNNFDFVSRFIKGCIEMGTAPDLDWLLDCCPVDFAASSIVKLSRNCDSNAVFHLINPHGRYWQECILWINLFGYPVRVIPYRAWLSELHNALRSTGHPLRELAPFFCRPVPGDSNAHLPQLYEETRWSSLSAAQSDETLARTGLECPPLNARLFDLYFESFIASGFLPPVKEIRRSVAGEAVYDRPAFLSTILGRDVSAVFPIRANGGHSIITELTSWRFRNAAGLFPRSLKVEGGETLEVMIKLKPRDTEVLEVGESIAQLCSDELGRAYRQFRDQLEFFGCNSREPAIYGQRDPRFRNHLPAFHGARDNVLIMEYLSDVVLKDTADDVTGWTRPYINATIEGLASLHAVWFGREKDLLRDSILGPTMIMPDMVAMTPLWRALADHARAFFGEEIGRLQEQGIFSLVDNTSLANQLPTTLIHNDFNPRNIALRTSGGLRLCAYDWEMARVGLPQHDLAELLCFVLDWNVSSLEVKSFIELHRSALERESGVPIDKESWLLGFRLSLLDLLVNRFAMYTMVHRFRKQPFLSRVMKTWSHLYDL